MTPDTLPTTPALLIAAALTILAIALEIRAAR